jgi:hypothetical protein
LVLRKRERRRRWWWRRMLAKVSLLRPLRRRSRRGQVAVRGRRDEMLLRRGDVGDVMLLMNGDVVLLARRLPLPGLPQPWPRPWPRRRGWRLRMKQREDVAPRYLILKSILYGDFM